MEAATIVMNVEWWELFSSLLSPQFMTKYISHLLTMPGRTYDKLNVLKEQQDKNQTLTFIQHEDEAHAELAGPVTFY